MSLYNKIIDFQKLSAAWQRVRRNKPAAGVDNITWQQFDENSREQLKQLQIELAEQRYSPLPVRNGIRYGRKSLALDLMEEFRQPVIDRLVLMLFNKQMIGVYDFESDEDGRVLLTEDGYKTFCREYERWMSGRNSNSGDPSFRNRIKQQIASFRRTIQNDEPYVPFSL